MEERGRNVMVGLTAIAGLIGLAALLMMFGYLPRWLDAGYAVRVELPSGGGLVKGCRVRMSGIDVGRVVSVDFQPPPKHGVVALLQITEGTAIPKSADVSVVAPLLTGSPSLAIDIAKLTPEAFADTLPTDGSAVVQGRVASLLADLNSALDGPLKSIRQDIKRPMQRFERIEKSFTELSTQWQQVAANVNQLIEPRSMAEVEAGKAEANLSTLVQRTDLRVAEMKSVLASMREVTRTAEKTAGKIDATADSATAALEAARKDFDQLTKRYLAVADDFSGLIRDTQKMVNKASEGEGTMGKLLNDPALYDNLNDSAERLGQAVDQIRLMIEKWNKEGVPVDF